MYKNNQLWNRYFPRSQRISYRYRETPQCPSIYIIDLNQFLLLFLLTITKQKYFSSSPKLFFYFLLLSLNLPCSLWFNFGTPKIILLRSPALKSEQAILAPLPGSCCVFRGNFWEQSTTGGNSSIGNFVPFLFPLFCFYFSICF